MDSVTRVIDADGRRHSRLTLLASLPFLSPHVSTASLSTATTIPASDTAMCPWLRETNFGESLAQRSKFQDSVGADSVLGPPDLVHWGRYSGSRLAQYTMNDFTKSLSRHDELKDDGYVGYYHYVNGLRLEYLENDIDEYVLGLVGIEREEGNYYFKRDAINADRLNSFKRDMVVTYCTYNLFNKSDFKAKFIIQLSGNLRRVPVHIDRSYHIVPNPLTDQRTRKQFNFSWDTIKGLAATYWEELRAAQLVRLFTQLDNPAQQLTGLVTYSNTIDTKAALIGSIRILVRYLPKSSLAGSNSGYGPSSACGNKGDSTRKTSSYRNNLVDTLVRVCQLDISGAASEFAVGEIHALYPQNEWDYIILRLYKGHNGSNKEQAYIKLIHRHLSTSSIFSTQLGLILQEQVRFLISKGDYHSALVVAKKSVQVLPLDFDAWYSLSLCYILIKDYEKALLVINTLPVILNNKLKVDTEYVSGVRDLFTSIFIERLHANNEEVILERTFKSYFPNPRVNATDYKIKSKDTFVDEGSVERLWRDFFIFNPNLRHPINGNYFYQSPLLNCSARELSSVNPALIKLCGPNSAKNILASQSSGNSSSSIMDFYRKSTWGRCYDLLSLLVAEVGWDELVRLKEKVFNVATVTNGKSYVVNHNTREDAPVFCEKWLDQLFLVIYDDLRTLMMIAANDREQQHSVIEWEVLGLLGWSVKYNLKESISSLMTSILGASTEGGFDYFGTVQLLEIYDEFILSDTIDSNIDLFNDDYDLKFFSNKLVLKLSEHYDGFVKLLEEEYLTLDFVLLQLMKLISWNLRWYQYTPNYLVARILSKLIIKYDLVYITTHLRVVFEQNKKSSVVKPKGFSLGSLLGAGSKAKPTEAYEFVEEDTIFNYVERVIGWIDGLQEN